MTSTWDLRVTPDVYNEWNSVTYGNELFVAVSNYSYDINYQTINDDRVMTSPDGITWTIGVTPDINRSWRSVTYGIDSNGNGLFVAVAGYGADAGGQEVYDKRVMTSPDGIAWTIRETPEIPNRWRSVTYGNGLFVAVSEDGSSNNNRVMTSPDGITWTLRSTPDIVRNDWYSVTYGNGLFVSVSRFSVETFTGQPIYNNRVMTSPDGIAWTIRTTPDIDNNWQSVTYGNGLFVAVSSLDATPNTDRVMTSSDGINWNLVTTIPTSSNSWESVTYGNGLFVAVSDAGVNTNRVMTSPDGIAWTLRSTPDTNNSWRSVTYALDLFVAASSAGSSNTDKVMTNGTISCYNKGTKILCLVDNSELYIPIEDIQKGVLIKTYKHGYLPVELIGKRTAITSPNNEETKRLYKQKGGDLIVTGGHYLLVDELPDGLTHFFYNLNCAIEDKKILLACDSELFEVVNEVKTSELYHLVLETDTDEDKRYGIYADGVLTESTTKQHYTMCGFEDL